jgi:nucleoside-diphosphate-sugar epimerase
LDDLTGLEEGLRREPVDAAFHLAWSGVTGEFRNSTDTALSNVTGSLGVWDLLRNHGCTAFIGVGSQAEYGPRNTVLTEDLPTAPQTVYGATKLALGVLLRQLCGTTGMRFAWLRLLSTYGPGDDERHMVPSLIRTLLRGQKPALTAGEQIWDYLYVDDAAAALCAVLESDADGIFNLGSGQPCVLRDFVSQLRDMIDPQLPLGFGEMPYRHDQVMHLEADISRLTAATGWVPQTSLQDGIRYTVEWYRSQGERFDRN